MILMRICLVSDSKVTVYTHTHTLTITCTCCYDEIKGTQDLKTCSHADSLFLSRTVGIRCSTLLGSHLTKQLLSRCCCIRLRNNRQRLLKSIEELHRQLALQVNPKITNCPRFFFLFYEWFGGSASSHNNTRDLVLMRWWLQEDGLNHDAEALAAFEERVNELTGCLEAVQWA